MVTLLVVGCSSSRTHEEGRPIAAENVPTDPAKLPIAKGASDVPVVRVPSPAAPRVRRIEDLPSVTPIAMRPLSVEELPEAPSKGRRGLRGKGAPVGSAEAAGASPPLGSAAPTSRGGRALRVEDLPSESASARPLRPDELNPELVHRAEDLLWNSPAPIGTDVPLEVGGKAYIARFAVHYHEFGGTKRPWGYHKGVTLYTTGD